MAKDDEEAAHWYFLAADQGHARAQHSLGVCYRDGKGVPVDEPEAVAWCVEWSPSVSLSISPSVSHSLFQSFHDPIHNFIRS